MCQTWDNSQLLRRVLWISAELTIVSSLKHKNTQPLYIFNRVRVLHLDRLKEGTWLHSFGFCNHSVNLHEIFLHRTNSKSLYLGGIYIFFHTFQGFLWAFYFFSVPMCISLTFCNPECRRKNSSAKSKQGKIEDMHSWRCFPLGAIHKWRHQFFLIFDPSLPYISTYVHCKIFSP